MIFDYLSPNDFLKVSILNSNIHLIVTPIIERNFSFMSFYHFYLFQIHNLLNFISFCRLQSGMTMTTLAPQKLNICFTTKLDVPPTVKHLKIFHALQTHISYNLPPTLLSLCTDNEFNLPLDTLPPTLTHLTTGSFFNQPVDKLPPTLTHLTTGSFFNQPVDNLPTTLTHLTNKPFEIREPT
jgi:hypothetical protein